MASLHHIQESLAPVIEISPNSHMLSEYHLMTPILKCQSGRISDLFYIIDTSVGLRLDSILGWRGIKSSQHLEERSLILFYMRDMAYLPFSLWHLMEIWPLLKTDEWDAAEDRKTRVGWRRNNCGLSSTEVSHRWRCFKYNMFISSASDPTFYFMTTNILVLPKAWDFHFDSDPHSGWFTRPRGTCF